jgi:hypothetical protein
MSIPNIPIEIIFKDRDGSLIMSRKANAYWFDRNSEFLKISLEADARTKGVRIISSDYKYSYGDKLVSPKAGGAINCVVDYL